MRDLGPTQAILLAFHKLPLTVSSRVHEKFQKPFPRRLLRAVSSPKVCKASVSNCTCCSGTRTPLMVISLP